MTSKRNFDDPAYKRARDKSRKRDGHKCQMPGCNSKRRLHSHHIQPWSQASSMRYEDYNLITLCRSCHESIKGKESFYIGMFMEIVKKNENNKRH